MPSIRPAYEYGNLNTGYGISNIKHNFHCIQSLEKEIEDSKSRSVIINHIPKKLSQCVFLDKDPISVIDTISEIEERVTSSKK
jgi:hypothetical protein